MQLCFKKVFLKSSFLSFNYKKKMENAGGENQRSLKLNKHLSFHSLTLKKGFFQEKIFPQEFGARHNFHSKKMSNYNQVLRVVEQKA